MIQGTWEKHPCTSASPSVSWRGWTRWFSTAFSVLTLPWISINFAYLVYSPPLFGKRLLSFCQLMWSDGLIVLLSSRWGHVTQAWIIGEADPPGDGSHLDLTWPEYLISFSHYVMHMGIGPRWSSVSPFWDFQLLRKRTSISARIAEEDRLCFKSCWYPSCHYQGRACLIMELTLKKTEARKRGARLGPDPDNNWNPWIQL